MIEWVQACRPHLQIIDTSEWSKDQWLAFRMTGVGCSETGTILGHNNFEEPAILFAKKIGIIPVGTVDNEAMFMGRVLEDIVANLWQHHDMTSPNWENTARNMEEGVVVRRMLKPKMYVRNPKYPYLFGGPDGLFDNEGKLAGLEIKTIAGFAADKYTAGIPTSYIFQVYAYMMLFDVDYWEIAILKDGRTLNVIPFHRDERIITMIDDTCSKFWNNVVKAKKFYNEGNFAEVDKLEPEPSDTKAYESYLNERFRSSTAASQIAAKKATVKHVLNYDKWREKADVAETKKRLYSNHIKRFMGDMSELIDVPGFSISWREGVKGRSFRVTKKSE